MDSSARMPVPLEHQGTGFLMDPSTGRGVPRGGGGHGRFSHLRHEVPRPSAQVLVGSSGSAIGRTAGASQDAGEPDHAGLRGGRSIWYPWTAPTSGDVVFDTYGSTFNREFGGNRQTFETVAALYAVDAERSDLVAANDNATPGLVSRVTSPATAGETYHVAVDGKGGLIGCAQLNWRPRLGLSAIPFGRGWVGFRLQCQTGDGVVIEASADLVDWIPWGTILADGESFKWSDPPEAGRRFYRARRE